MAEIEYFYSAHSGFAYLGSARFMEIAAAADRRIVHKPVDLDRVVEGAGSGSFRARSKPYRAYFYRREIDRWSEYRNAPILEGWPAHHYNDMTLANCTLIAGAQQGYNVDQLAHAMLTAHWKNNANLADRETLAGLVESVGLEPATLLAAAVSPDVKNAYNANTDEAIARSVFGSPTYFVDGDMFYGQDRLEIVERALKQPFSGEWPIK